MSDEESGGAQSTPRPRKDTPFGAGLSLGRWFGVSIHAHWSVVVIVLLFADLLARSELPTLRPGRPAAQYWLAGAITSVAFLVTLLAHELTHAVVARHYGLRVERITLWMLGGLTELDGEPPSPRADAAIAGSGPAVSLLIGAVCAVIAWALRGGGLLDASMAWLAAVSVVLGVFNLLPGAPLDGGRLVRAAMWARTRDRALAAERATSAGRAVGIVLVLLGVVELLSGAWSGLWLALIGWFVIAGAASERYSVRSERLAGLVVSDAMTAHPLTAADWWSVETLLAHLTPEHADQGVFPLVDMEGRSSGAIGLRDLERVPAARRADTRVHDLARRNPPLLVAPDAPLSDLLLPLHLRGGVAVVVDGARPIGLVREADLVAAARLRGLTS